MTGGKSVFTGLKATTHFGRPQMNKIMTAVHKAHPMVSYVFIIIIIIIIIIITALNTELTLCGRGGVKIQ